MRYFCMVLSCLLSLCLLCEVAAAKDKTQALSKLQELVNNQAQAKKMREKIKNASKRELAEFAELNEVIEKEISTMSSTLPQKIDKYTTMDSAAISGENIVFKYSLSNDMAGIEYKDEVMVEINNMVKNGFCTSPFGAWLILGYSWSYFYFRENGSYYGGFVIDAKTCGFE